MLCSSTNSSSATPPPAWNWLMTIFGETCGVRDWASVRVVYCSETAIKTKTAKKSKNFFITKSTSCLYPGAAEFNGDFKFIILCSPKEISPVANWLRKSEFVVPLQPFLHKAGDAFVIGKIGGSATGHHSNFVRYISPC